MKRTALNLIIALLAFLMGLSTHIAYRRCESKYLEYQYSDPVEYVPPVRLALKHVSLLSRRDLPMVLLFRDEYPPSRPACELVERRNMRPKKSH